MRSFTFTVMEDSGEQSICLAVPGDRADVAQRLDDAVGEWLMRTPVIRQSASSLARFLMAALEDSEVPVDDVG